MTKQDIKILILLNLVNFLIYAVIYSLSSLKIIKIPDYGLDFLSFLLLNSSGYVAGLFYYGVMLLLEKIFSFIKYIVIFLALYYTFGYILNIGSIIYIIFNKKVFEFEDTACLDENYFFIIVLFFNYLLIKKYFINKKET